MLRIAKLDGSGIPSVAYELSTGGLQDDDQQARKEQAGQIGVI